MTDGVTLTGAEVLELGALVNGGELVITGAALTLSFDGAGPPPVTTARVHDDGTRVIVVVSGVRRVSADLPLVVGEDGRVLGEPRAVDLGPVKSVARTFLGDDSAIQIEVELSAEVELDLRVGEQGRSVEVRMRTQ